MAHIVTGLFDTRREAEMAVERLVQEHNLDRARVRAHATGDDNSSGTIVSGADAGDAAAGKASEGVRRGRIAVSAEIAVADLGRVQDALRTCGASEVN